MSSKTNKLHLGERAMAIAKASSKKTRPLASKEEHVAITKYRQTEEGLLLTLTLLEDENDG
jgi:hypothetical protein